jgi:lipoprotein-releasing system permease protein
MVPAIDANGVPQPRVREFDVAGVFEVGIQDTDAVVILMHLSDARVMAGDEPRSGGWRLRFADLMQANEQLQQLQPRLPPGLEARAWSDDHASYFRAIRIEKTMMGLILMLIVAIAAFNLVAMLVMVVNDKRTDIAILRTFGATPAAVQGVFVTQGVVIGWLGVGLGVAAGVAIAKNATAVANFVERVFGFQFMNPDVYYVTQIPTDLRWPNVVLIGALALLLTTLAVLYPARRAAGVAPAEALRYE